jgi:hypothetical protein
VIKKLVRQNLSERVEFAAGVDFTVNFGDNKLHIADLSAMEGIGTIGEIRNCFLNLKIRIVNTARARVKKPS